VAKPAKTTSQFEKLTAELLQTTLRAAANAYYNSGKTLMSDAEFDSKVAQLRELDPTNSFLSEIGAPPSQHLSKAKHKIPMGSLNNCSRDGDKANPSFKEWHEKAGNREVCLMHKLDGSSVELIFEDGSLKQAITRGDGLTGEDITQNARKFKGIPSVFAGFSGSVRGEALLLLKDFQDHFKDQANPRNAANGTVRRSDGTGSEHISFIAYDVLADGLNFETHEKKLKFLSHAFNVVWYRVLALTDDVLQIHQETGMTRDSLPYEIDGLVAIVDEVARFNNLGWRDNRPKGGVAFKFQAMEATTKLLGIKLSIGHTGAIIPTADLAPVEIGGVTVTSALLNNYEEIERLGIALNDQVKVIRTGDVIPKIIGVAQPAADRKPIKAPTDCISCGSKLVKDGAHVFCRFDECDGKALRLIKTWITKRNILHLGDELLVELYEHHGVKEPQDLYGLTEEYLAKIPRGAGVVGGNAKRIMAELEKSKQCPLNEFMGSLGVKFLGRRQAEIMIGQGINSLEAFLTATTEQLKDLEGFSETKAAAMIEGIKKARYRVKALLDCGIEVVEVAAPEPVQAASDKLSGKNFCFTGAIEKVGSDGKRFTREMMWGVVQENGGQVSEEVRKGVTTHLVQADKNSTSSKTKKANQYGVSIISEAEFWSILS
jgi:DNA ligase (NAD+)